MSANKIPETNASSLNNLEKFKLDFKPEAFVFKHVKSYIEQETNQNLKDIYVYFLYFVQRHIYSVFILRYEQEIKKSLRDIFELYKYDYVTHLENTGMLKNANDNANHTNHIVNSQLQWEVLYLYTWCDCILKNIKPIISNSNDSTILNVDWLNNFVNLLFGHVLSSNKFEVINFDQKRNAHGHAIYLLIRFRNFMLTDDKSNEDINMFTNMFLERTFHHPTSH